ncbi:uncharacterized protein LOC129593166 [Paramacrobiotus metropolitanus]|uniref:uncharacterized protein LOC129593166 n=1 Tax=Paramacrobiotus metropolitanus TaxID=2943436 RepID=UPI00244618B7|nr:uncharacterized protein LOC129593166 [Paramacrobiotus metropolitanus]
METPSPDSLHLILPVPARKPSLFAPEPAGDLWEAGGITAFFFLLRCFGIFPCHQACRPRGGVSQFRAWQLLLVILTIAATVLDTWKSLVRYKNRISSLEFTALAMMITRLFFGLKCFLTIVKICRMSDRLKSLLVQLNTLCNEDTEKRRMRRQINRLALACFAFGLASLVAIWLAAYWSFSLIVNRMTTDGGWTGDTPNPLLGRVPVWVTFVLYLVAFTIHVGVDVFAQLLLVLLVYPLGLHFRQLAVGLTAPPGGWPEGYVGQATTRHLQLTSVVRTVNRHFSMVLLLMYLADLMGFITTTSLGLHRDSTKEYIDVELLPVFIGLVLISGMNALLRTGFAVWLSEKAHSVLPYLHEAQLRAVREDDRFLCGIFVARLQGTRIALTAGGFFYVTREFVITMFGILLTYVLFVYQMEDKKMDVASLSGLPRLMLAV